MKKRPLSLLLVLSLLLPALTAPAGAIRISSYSIRTNEDGKSWISQICIDDEQGNSQWFDIYDEEGNQLYQQVGESMYKWEKLDPPIPAAEVQRRKEELEAQYRPVVALKKAGIEQVYHVRIGDDFIGGDQKSLDLLNALESAILDIPAPLWEAVNADLAKQGSTLTIVFDRKLADTELAGKYYPDRVEIALVPNADTIRSVFAHEYGHMVFETVLPRIYGGGTFKSMWTAQNEGRAYGDWDDDEENPAFVTGYASSRYVEDCAETFSFVLGHSTGNSYFGQETLDLGYKRPNSTAVKKLAYTRQLLCEAFSLAPSVFPDLTPSQPSSWAKEAVEEYQDLFGYMETGCGVVPTAGLAHPTGYQTGATRVNFAYSMYHQVVRDLWWRIGEDWKNWSIDGFELRNIEIDGNFPFADVKIENGGIYAEQMAQAVYLLHQNGVISGTGENTFSPEGLITRQEAAAMLYRLCGAMQYELPAGELTFDDSDQIASWAREAVAAITAAGIMNGVGNGNFDPTGVYSNEQSALTLLRLYKLLAAEKQ